jgi:hypothetical protein
MNIPKDNKPCPFCGSIIMLIKFDRDEDDKKNNFRMECFVCLANGPIAETKVDAEEFWEMRFPVKHIGDSTKMVWIPVQLRLPEKGVEVLVLNKEKKCEVAWLNVDSEEPNWMSYSAIGAITHWTTIPEFK